MKRAPSLIITLIFLLGCDEPDHRKTTPIEAGEMLSVFFDAEPDAVISPQMECVPSGNFIACDNATGQLKIDFDGDGSTDAHFKTNSTLLGNRLGILTTTVELTNRNFQALPTPLDSGAIIFSSQQWTELFLSLANRTQNGTLVTEQNPWSEFRFLALRMATPADTTFGWVRLKIENSAILTVDRFSFQK